jgi:excisionase family DNA binding protein
MMSSQLSLAEVAEELNVHYMTVYRYVRLGLLPAQKSGSQWQVDRGDLATFRSGERQIGDADAPWAERLESRMIAGDSAGAWGVVEAALAAGHTPTFIYAEVLAPAMVEIGRRWEAGDVDVADEHLASAVAMRIVGRLGPRFSRRGRSRGTVLCAMPEGDQHGLGSAMVADVIRGAGFEALDLGANTPLAALIAAVRRVDDLKALCLSINNTAAFDRGREMVTAVRSIDPELAILGGGRAVDSDQAAERLGIDGWGVSVTDAVGLLEAVVSPRP